MKITDYLLNKDLKIEEKDFDIEKLTSDLRKGYVKETDVESRLESSKKDWEAQSNKNYSELNEKYTSLEKSYNDTVSNLDKANKELNSEKLKVIMMSQGFKKEQFDEVSKLRTSLYADEKDDEKAISGIAEKFKGTYFASQNQNQNDGEPPIRGNGGTAEPQIKVDRSTPLKDLFKKK